MEKFWQRKLRVVQFFQQTSENNFSALHVDIRSLRKYWKKIQVIVKRVMHAVDAFVLTEMSVQRDMLDRCTLP